MAKKQTAAKKKSGAKALAPKESTPKNPVKAAVPAKSVKSNPGNNDKKQGNASEPKENAPSRKKPAASGKANKEHAEAPEYLISLKKKLHREIFEKCVEKKMLQDFDFWET